MTNKEQSRANIVKETLSLENKFFQNILGSNSIKTNPNDFGNYGVAGANPIYEGINNSEEFEKARTEDYNARKQEMKENKVFGEPAYLANPDLHAKFVKQIREVMQIAKIGELEKYIAKSDLDFEISDDVKDISLMDVMDYAVKNNAVNDKGQIILDALDEKHQKAYAAYNVLSEAYDMNASLAVARPGYFAKINELGKSAFSEKADN